MKRESMQGIILEYQNYRPDIDNSVFIAPNACVIGDVEKSLITIFEFRNGSTREW